MCIAVLHLDCSHYHAHSHYATKMAESIDKNEGRETLWTDVKGKYDCLACREESKFSKGYGKRNAPVSSVGIHICYISTLAPSNYVFSKTNLPSKLGFWCSIAI